jgi:hypothetical protein
MLLFDLHYHRNGYDEKFKDTKEVIRSRYLNKYGQHTGQTKHMTSNDIQNIIQKARNRATRTH